MDVSKVDHVLHIGCMRVGSGRGHKRSSRTVWWHGRRPEWHWPAAGALVRTLRGHHLTLAP
jgi:hypothetical protein